MQRESQIICVEYQNEKQNNHAILLHKITSQIPDLLAQLGARHNVAINYVAKVAATKVAITPAHGIPHAKSHFALFAWWFSHSYIIIIHKIWQTTPWVSGIGTTNTLLDCIRTSYWPASYQKAAILWAALLAEPRLSQCQSDVTYDVEKLYPMC